MKVANTVDLKNRTNKLLRQVMKGEPVIVTFRGKPAAAITPLAEAEADRKAGRVIPLKAYLGKQRGR